VLLLAAALVAALWRGRRFGPLVTERLPVTVRANETTIGRARLYANARDAPHALDELRRAARGRLERLLGLPTRTDAGQIVDAVTDRLGADRARVRAILVDDRPRTDRDLVAAADRLRDLEASVRAAVRTEGTTR
jgi:acyl-homoserine lactone acylase PvdQ